MDQPGKVANPARGQLNRENNIPLSPCVPENLVSRDGFSRPVPRQPAHLHTQAESGAYLRDSSRVPRRRPYETAIRHRVSPEFIGSRNCVPMALPFADHLTCRPSLTHGPYALYNSHELKPIHTAGLVDACTCAIAPKPYSDSFKPSSVLLLPLLCVSPCMVK